MDRRQWSGREKKRLCRFCLQILRVGGWHTLDSFLCQTLLKKSDTNLRRLDRALPLLGDGQTNVTVRRLLLHNAK
jgi:hypothetical protein